MAFCPNCGSKLEDGAKFCAVCGYATEQAQGGAGQPYVAPVYKDPNDFTDQYAPEDIGENKKLAALSYLGVLVFLPFLASPKSEYCRFHANQSVALMVLTLLCSLCLIVPFLGWIVGGVGDVVCLVFLIMGFVRAWKGKAKALPICGKWTFFKVKLDAPIESTEA